MVQRPWSLASPNSLSIRRFRHSAICILHFELPPRPRSPDGWGSPCPLNGPRSCGRHSPGNRSRSGRCNSQRSGPMLGPRTGLRTSGRNSIPSWRCTCALNRTRSGYRNSYRPCRRTGFRACVRNSICSRPRNSVRSGPRSRSRNSRRSCFCNGIQPSVIPLFPSPRD